MFYSAFRVEITNKCKAFFQNSANFISRIFKQVDDINVLW